ncbi:TolC family protein [Tamlana agarivorans]|uniref:TolC family protein n=1 Tax=Pseudotamlana agarivorans TaxID=481183 RepID=A0ACC5U631_9FLAO|nr:TolC family protein [Tamlana agarivorans]MBU2949768.1 TolC family protein [Tamlana agarivorans]
MGSIKNFVLIFLIFSVSSLALNAQRNLSDHELQLIALGLEKSYALKAANYEIAIDSLEYKSIRRNFIPTLEFDALYGYGSTQIITNIPTIQLPITGINLFEGDQKFNANGSFANANLTAKALLFSGLQVNYGAKATNEKIRAKNYLLFKERGDIIKDVISTFDNIELLNQSKHVLETGLKRIVKEKERVVKAIANGLATPYERDKITAAELNIAAKQTEIYGNLSLLYLKLSMLTGIETTKLKAYTFELKPWLIKMGDKSFIDRPEVKALDASIKAYDYKLKMNKNLFLPKIQALASLSYSNLFNAELDTPYNTIIGNEPINLELNKFQLFPTYFLGVGMKWEIFSGLKHTTEISKTTIEKSMAEEKKVDALEKLELFSKKTQVDFEVKNKQLLYKEQEKLVALNNLNSAIKRYKSGLMPITERLEAETSYQDVSFEYYKLIVQQRMAALELLISTGSLQTLKLNPRKN